MDLLKNLIETVGLDASFFYQLFLAVPLYFVSKKLVFQPYLKSYEKRQTLTKGRMQESQDLEKKITEQKSLYEKKAKEVHQKFQEVFGKNKQVTQENYLKEKEEIENQNKQSLDQKRKHLTQSIKEQSEGLEKDLPFLASLLLEKIKN